MSILKIYIAQKSLSKLDNKVQNFSIHHHLLLKFGMHACS